MTSVASRAIRKIIITQARRANVGHIGSALCVADILAALYGEVLRLPSPADPDRDRFVLSKGHSALALYAALHLRGWLTKEQLNGYCADGSLLGVHPDRALAGVDFCTGSLGQGATYAAGAALAARMQGSSRRAFALLSDAECNEGAVWEAAMFAAHHKLSNLTFIVDRNRQQALGYTREVLDVDLVAAWRAFGWDVHEMDGHDVAGLARAMQSFDSRSGPPHMIIANTVFGKGVSFMINQIRWHYLPLSEAQYEQALREIEES